MSQHFATALARTDGKWTGSELDLKAVEDLDGLVDILRDLAGEPVLLFVEEDDEYVGVVRVDGLGDPRVFLSDRRVVSHSDIAALLAESADVPAATTDDDESSRPEADPSGDTALLADFGTGPDELIALCAEEGQLPADIITVLCERAGCVDTLEELRGG